MALESSEELTGIEWEAEKAYIVATSPRSSATPGQESDEFSWDMETVPVREKLAPAASPRATHQQQHRRKEEEQNLSHDHHLRDEGGVAGTSAAGTLDVSRELESACKQQNSDESVQEEAIHFGSSGPSSPNMCSEAGPGLQSHKSVAAAPKSLVHNASAQTLVVFGPPGLGRGTLVQKLVYRSPQLFALAVSHTTRSPRLHETYARDFYFVSRSEMLRAISQGRFIEYVQVDSDRRHPGKTYSPSINPCSSPDHRSSSFSSPSSSSAGDLFGTTWDAFYEAQYSGKPCITINVTTKGAEQLREAGIQGHYVLLQLGTGDVQVSFEPDKIIHIDSTEEGFHELEECALSLISGAEPVLTSSEQEQLQWERVPTVQLQGGAKLSPAVKTRKKQLCQSLVSYSELLSHFQNADLSVQLAAIHPECKLSGFSRLLPPPRVAKHLHQERNLVFAIALCRFNDNNTVHTRTLQTIYRRLTGETTCQRFGAHWEDIGFQGSDPVEDLRGVGMLGLVQLVWLLENPVTFPIAQEVFRSLKDSVPFCVLSLNSTSMALTALREGSLSRECNQKEQVFAVVNNLYAAVLVSFSHSWRKKKRGMMEAGVMLQEMGVFAKKHARYLIREFEQHLKERQQQSSLSRGGRGVLRVQPAVRFTPMEANDHVTVHW